MGEILDKIKQLDDNGHEFWLARDLMVALDYKEWRNFKRIIDKVVQVFELSEEVINEHFSYQPRIVDIAKKARRQVEDYKLSRYACYLIVNTADPHKLEVALARKYFKIPYMQEERLEDQELKDIKGQGIFGGILNYIWSI